MADTDKQINNSNKPWQFQPGQSGNLKGRPPKKKVVSDQLLVIAKEKPELAKAVAGKLWELALRGDISAMREVMDRLEGKPSQHIDLDMGEEITEEKLDEIDGKLEKQQLVENTPPVDKASK